MSAAKRWTRKLKGSGPADTYLDRYQIQGTSPRYQVVDLVTGAQVNRRSIRTMRAAREFIENNCAVMS